MAQPPRKPPSTATSDTEGVGEFPALLRALAGPGPGPRIKANTAGQVLVLEADGPLIDVVSDLDRTIGLALAELPRGVVVDLSAVKDCGAAGALRMLASAGRHVRDWPGTPVAVASPDPQVRETLAGKPLGADLLVTETVQLALTAVLRRAPPTVQSVRLAPHPTAPRAARNFVTRALLDWQLVHHMTIACLVTSELVTNAIIHAGTAIDVRLAAHQGALRLTVRDHGPPLQPWRTDLLAQHGRGLTLVEGLSTAWGVLPTASEGKVVWAALADSRPEGRHVPLEAGA